MKIYMSISNKSVHHQTDLVKFQKFFSIRLLMYSIDWLIILQ